MKIVKCENCGVEFKAYGSKSSNAEHHFCCAACARSWRSQHMKDLNRELNKTRMTPEVRSKLRDARLDSGAGKTYAKTYGRHTHRIVAEQILGRPLRSGEVVHHKDGNKRNNDPSNLVVFASAAEHARYHMLLKYHGVQGT